MGTAMQKSSKPIDNIPAYVPFRSEFVSPSTAPTTIPEEDEYDAHRRESVAPWESVSVAGMDEAQYQTYMADARRTFKEPPGDAAAAATAANNPGPASSSSSQGQQQQSSRQRHHHGSGYSSSYRATSDPPPQYRHGSEVPWEDSAYHSAGGGSRPVSSSSRTRRTLPAYTSHDYVQRGLQSVQQQEQQRVDIAADYTAVDPDPTYAMNGAYAAMPGYHGGGGGGGGEEEGYDASVWEESDRMSFEVEEEGGRRRVRGSRTITSRGSC
ncbi:hypothetical protein PG996_012036 [Apiospora saccharicola]|uniref:Uncharacterized protein n=1 Tax=Apiospora saccharicola TaxID=335842 RepID=A0ABR1U1G2_9PEZI